jgi:HD domain
MALLAQPRVAHEPIPCRYSSGPVSFPAGVEELLVEVVADGFTLFCCGPKTAPNATDLDHVAKNYVHTTPNEQVTAEQTSTLPQPLAALLRGLVAEYVGRSSPEAECARDADKLEMLLQALDYRQQGYTNTQPFIQTAVTALRTVSGRSLGEAAMRVDPATWWRADQAATMGDM